MLYFFLFLSLYCSVPVISDKIFDNHQYQWSSIDYKYDDEKFRVFDAFFAKVVEKEQVIIDAEGSKDGRIFITVQSTQSSPASLTVIEKADKLKDSPQLRPYPDWTWADQKNCNSIISAYRFAMDDCNRLWVLDTGVIGSEQFCPNKLLAFDLNTDKLILKFDIPDNVTYKNIFGQPRPLVTPIVETVDGYCDQTYVYMADASGHNLVVYNGISIWRVEPQHSVDETLFYNTSLFDGLAGFAMSPLVDSTERFIFHRPQQTKQMAEAQTWNLRRSNKFPMMYNEYSGYLLSQATAMAFTPNGTLFFALSNSLAIGCWHLSQPLDDQNIELLHLKLNPNLVITGLKVIPREKTNDENQIWISGYERATGLKSSKITKIFVYSGIKIDSLIAGTKCDPRPKFKHPLDETYEFLKKKYL